MGWKWQKQDNLCYLTLPEWQAEGIDLGFSCRVGGVSQVPYDTFNLGLHVGDDPSAVLVNRSCWFQHWQVDWSKVVVGQQVHGKDVLWVNDHHGGLGARELGSAIPDVDGLLTSSNGLGLMAFFADCVPLFFYYPDLKAVGLVHAGWKGTAQKIGQKAIECFENAGGCTEKAWFGIGPSIGPCCYIVDEQVAEKFRNNYGNTTFLRPHEEGHYLLDLWEANRALFLEKGAQSDNIAVAAMCTADNPDLFFSHRRDGARTGRMAGWIKIKSTNHER